MHDGATSNVDPKLSKFSKLSTSHDSGEKGAMYICRLRFLWIVRYLGGALGVLPRTTTDINEAAGTGPFFKGISASATSTDIVADAWFV